MLFEADAQRSQVSALFLLGVQQLFLALQDRETAVAELLTQLLYDFSRRLLLLPEVVQLRCQRWNAAADIRFRWWLRRGSMCGPELCPQLIQLSLKVT
jgi:hypothetical protein